MSTHRIPLEDVLTGTVLGSRIPKLYPEEITMSERVVRAKFWLVSKKELVNATEVELNAVCRGEDNKAWASATPIGNIKMNVLSEAFASAHAGDEFYVDFVPAPKGQQGMGD